MRPLEHLILLDLTHMLSGPYGTMLLADLGMKTIKVEPPLRGEGTRKLLANSEEYSNEGMGAYFLTLNRNKSSICIDLKTKAGLSVFYDLVKKADVVFDNFSPGVTERLGINYETLKNVNPRIITCSVSGFGGTGPERHLPAFDMVAQGMGGGMSITGEPETSPLRAGIPIGDLGGGLFGAIGVLSALASREQTGRGQHVDISMLDGQISLLNYMATMQLLSGKDPSPEGNGHFVHVPYRTFVTKTRHLIIAVITDNFWKSLVDVLDDESLRDPTYDTQPGRLANRSHIDTRVGKIIEQNTCEYWLDRLRAARIPCAPVNRFSDALSEPQIQSRDMIVEVTSPSGKTVKMPGNPIKLSEMNEDGYSYPPELGANTHEILTDLLGYSGSEIKNLMKQEIIG